MSLDPTRLLPSSQIEVWTVPQTSPREKLICEERTGGLNELAAAVFSTESVQRFRLSALVNLVDLTYVVSLTVELLELNIDSLLYLQNSGTRFQFWSRRFGFASLRMVCV
jgi:hypothetical protein